MKLNHILLWASVLLLVAFITAGNATNIAASESNKPLSPAQRPNLVLIVADDLGYGDLSCFGATHVETPNVDTLATEGRMLTQFYAGSAVCSPSRASILTGRCPLRFDIRSHFKDLDEHLPRGVTTLPRLLSQGGYATAHIGKWHLGGVRREYIQARVEGKPNPIPGPHEHGFEHYLTPMPGPERLALVPKGRLHWEGARYLVRNDKPVSLEGYTADVYTKEAMDMIQRYHNEGRPFYVNLWFKIPHGPYEPAPEPHLSKYKARGATGTGLCYLSMVSKFDACVGQVVSKLKQLGIFDNTLLIVTSDNGPALHGSAAPFTGCKGILYEGGIRVPAIAVWPGHIPAGYVSDDLCGTIDLLPTFCEAADVPLPKDLKIDGKSLLPNLVDGKRIDRDTNFWQMDQYGPFQRQTVKIVPATEVARQGKWKLLGLHGKPVALFDLDSDPRETTNLLDKHPEIEKQLVTELKSWLAEPRRSWRQK